MYFNKTIEDHPSSPKLLKFDNERENGDFFRLFAFRSWQRSKWQPFTIFLGNVVPPKRRDDRKTLHHSVMIWSTRWFDRDRRYKSVSSKRSCVAFWPIYRKVCLWSLLFQFVLPCLTLFKHPLAFKTLHYSAEYGICRDIAAKIPKTGSLSSL